MENMEKQKLEKLGKIARQSETFVPTILFWGLGQAVGAPEPAVRIFDYS